MPSRWGTALGGYPSVAGSGCSCINAAVGLVARRSASAGSGVAATPSSKPTISPSQRSPKYCIAISAGCPGPMSPVNWAIVNSTASARRVASRPAELRAWAISGERVASAIAKRNVAMTDGWEVSRTRLPRYPPALAGSFDAAILFAIRSSSSRSICRASSLSAGGSPTYSWFAAVFFQPIRVSAKNIASDTRARAGYRSPPCRQHQGEDCCAHVKADV